MLVTYIPYHQFGHTEPSQWNICDVQLRKQMLSEHLTLDK